MFCSLHSVGRFAASFAPLAANLAAVDPLSRVYCWKAPQEVNSARRQHALLQPTPLFCARRNCGTSFIINIIQNMCYPYARSGGNFLRKNFVALATCSQKYVKLVRALLKISIRHKNKSHFSFSWWCGFTRSNVNWITVSRRQSYIQSEVNSILTASYNKSKDFMLIYLLFCYEINAIPT